MTGAGAQGLEGAMQLYRAGRKAQAEAALRKLLKQPELAAQAAAVLSSLLMQDGRFENARFEVERALGKNPDDVGLLMAHQAALQGTGKPELALAAATRAFELAPKSADVAVSIGSLHLNEGRLAEAEHWYTQALRLDPNHLLATSNLVLVFCASLQTDKALALIREALQGPRRGLDMQQLLAFVLQFASGVEPQEVFEAHRLAGLEIARAAEGFPPRIAVEADPERVLTIGYVSPDFRQHACAHFAEPLLAARDRSAFRVIAYSAVASPDEVTKRFKGLVDVWRDIGTLSDAALAQQIAADKVDIAIDLAGHTGGSRVTAFAHRPAPITAMYMGYPSTTGLPGMDLRIVDSTTDPAGAEAFATEKLVRIDPCFLCYRPPTQAEVSPLPCMEAGHITFGSFNILNKVSPATLDLWAEVLKSVAGSKMLLKSRMLAEGSSVAQRVRAAFTERGIDPARIDLGGWIKDRRGHLDTYRRVHIALDTIPYNGTTTTCEAMWAGVPVIALRGRMHAGRVGATLVNTVGFPELVASDEQEYVRIATSLAADRERLASIRAGLRQKMAASPLCDERGFTKQFESALRAEWRAWCAARK